MILHPHTLVVFALLKNSKKTLFYDVCTLFLVVQWKQSGWLGGRAVTDLPIVPHCALCHHQPPFSSLFAPSQSQEHFGKRV